MEGYNPLGAHYVANPLGMAPTGSGDEYMNIMAPMGMTDQTNTYNPNAYPR